MHCLLQWTFLKASTVSSNQTWSPSLLTVKPYPYRLVHKMVVQVYSLHAKQPLTHITTNIHVLSALLQVKGKSVLTTSIEGSNIQNQMTTDEGNQPDSRHKLTSCKGTPCVSRHEMVIDDTLQSQRRASIQQDASALTQLSQRKASLPSLPSRGVQLPQNLINELSTVLNKTGRSLNKDD